MGGGVFELQRGPPLARVGAAMKEQPRWWRAGGHFGRWLAGILAGGLAGALATYLAIRVPEPSEPPEPAPHLTYVLSIFGQAEKVSGNGLIAVVPVAAIWQAGTDRHDLARQMRPYIHRSMNSPTKWDISVHVQNEGSAAAKDVRFLIDGAGSIGRARVDADTSDCRLVF